MSETPKEIAREVKERGFRIYKWILNVFTIGLLIQLYRSLYVTHDGQHWLYGIATLYFILRLATFARRERKAYELGISVTEYMERKTKELRDRNNKNKE